MDSRRFCLALLALMVAATVAIIMATEPAEAGYLIGNGEICKSKTTQTACLDCCFSKGYSRTDSQFLGGVCTCHLAGQRTKVRVTDTVYEVDKDEGTSVVIEAAEGVQSYQTA